MKNFKLHKNDNLVSKKYRILKREDDILLEHNILPYYNVAKVFKDGSKKVAVVRATGTGKAFITTKLLWQFYRGGLVCATDKKPFRIESDKNPKFLYLAPTKAILQQFKKDIEKTGKVKMLENITFMTYAGLLTKVKNLNRQLEENELSTITINEKEQKWFTKFIKSFSTIVLDEFHRVDENKWGMAVKIAMEQCGNTKFFGTTATPVRSSGRDTAESIFENNVVSTLSLADAINDKILPMPDYYTAIYSYDKIIKSYEKRISRIKDKKKQVELTQLVDEIKKQILTAGNIENILIEQLSKNQNGKYIIFNEDINTSKDNIEKLKDMLAKKLKINKVYEVHSKKSKALNDIDDFENNNSEGLKLLFVVDMLNEGVHIKGVDGVIMLRKTNSFIVYQQQLGRALSCERENKNPLILDLVNNLSSTFEYDETVSQIQRFWGSISCGKSENNNINNLIARLKKESNVIASFKKLDILLSNNFEDRIYPLVVWHNQTGLPLSEINTSNINPTLFIVEGKEENLKNIILNLRNAYKKTKDKNFNTRLRPLTEAEIKTLEDMGMAWEGNPFDERIKPLVLWQNQTGLPLSKIKYNDTFIVDNKQVNIGNLINVLRQAYIGHGTSRKLTAEEIKTLEDMGMKWVTQKSKNKLEPLIAWHNQTGLPLSELKISVKNPTIIKVNDENVNLTYVMQEIKKSYRKATEKNYGGDSVPLTKEEIKTLEDMGIKWTQVRNFQKIIYPLKVWQERTGLPISEIKTTEKIEIDGQDVNVGNIIRRLRMGYKRAKGQNHNTNSKALTLQEINILEDMGMSWDDRLSFKERIYPLIKWQEENNKPLSVIKYYETIEIDGETFNIGRLIMRLRREYRKAKGEDLKSVSPLKNEEIQFLEHMGIAWNVEKTKNNKVDCSSELN